MVRNRAEPPTPIVPMEGIEPPCAKAAVLQTGALHRASSAGRTSKESNPVLQFWRLLLRHEVLMLETAPAFRLSLRPTGITTEVMRSKVPSGISRFVLSMSREETCRRCDPSLCDLDWGRLAATLGDRKSFKSVGYEGDENLASDGIEVAPGSTTSCPMLSSARHAIPLLGTHNSSTGVGVDMAGP